MPSECGRGSVGSSAASLLCVSGHACSVRLSPSNGSCSGGTHRASHPCVSVCAFSGPLDSETSTDRTGIDAGAWVTLLPAEAVGPRAQRRKRRRQRWWWRQRGHTATQFESETLQPPQRGGVRLPEHGRRPRDQSPVLSAPSLQSTAAAGKRRLRYTRLLAATCALPPKLYSIAFYSSFAHCYIFSFFFWMYILGKDLHIVWFLSLNWRHPSPLLEKQRPHIWAFSSCILAKIIIINKIHK